MWSLKRQSPHISDVQDYHDDAVRTTNSTFYSNRVTTCGLYNKIRCSFVTKSASGYKSRNRFLQTGQLPSMCSPVIMIHLCCILVSLLG